MIIVTDLEGRFETLMALLAKIPGSDKEEVICLGDVIDRGPKSKETLEWFKNNPNATLLMGNHEHMMIDAYRKGGFYDHGIWECNGGMATQRSFGYDICMHTEKAGDWRIHVPGEMIEWLESRPLFIEEGPLLLTHAPLPAHTTVDEACNLGSGFTGYYCSDSENSILWNRYGPYKKDGTLQIFGHNRASAAKIYTDEYENGLKYTDERGVPKDPWAICLDSGGRDCILSALQYPQMKIYTQKWIDVQEI